MINANLLYKTHHTRFKILFCLHRLEVLEIMNRSILQSFTFNKLVNFIRPLRTYKILSGLISVG